MNYYFLMTYKTDKMFEVAIQQYDYFGIIGEYTIITDESKKKNIKKLPWSFLNPTRCVEFGLPEKLIFLLDFYIKSYCEKILDLPSRENHQFKNLDFHITKTNK
ncbi:hypothetical protein [Epilithonimonas hispanica]|nr:hypothetical protein [Epilithonimonas hispanica]